MSESTLRIVLCIIVISAMVGFLAMTSDFITRLPAIPAFGFGILTVLSLEAIIYIIYRIAKYIGGG